MNLPRFSIQHPVTITMFIFVAVTIGLMALWELPTDMFPEITFPVISVVTRYPGSAPEEVENLITDPLEQALATVHGVTQVKSVSQHSLSMVNLRFDWGADLDSAANDVRDALHFSRRFLPEDAPQSAIVKIDLSKMPVWIGTLRGKRSLPSLKRIADNVIQPRLARIDGVAAMGVLSEEEEEILVRARLKALETFGVGFNRLYSLLLGLNRNFPGGDVHAGGRTMPVRTMGEHAQLGDLSALPLWHGPDETVVTLGQVADVSRGVNKQEVMIHRNGRACLALQVMKQSGKNSVKILRQVNQELDHIRTLLPADVKLEPVFDQAEFINKSIRSVTTNFFLGGALALLVLYVFLRRLSLLFVIGLTIPLSVLVTFIPLYFLRFSLNLMSLGGLALGVGMLVDNAIVVLENIDRHLALGKPPAQAAEDGAREVAGAITGSTLTTLIIFVPFLFSEGIAARLFTPLGLTVSTSLLGSLVLSLTIVPMLTAHMLRSDPFHAPLPDMPRYRAAVAWALHRPWKVTVGFLLVFLVAVGVVAPRLGWEYIPVADDGMIGSPFSLPVGYSLEETRHALEPLVNKLASDPRVFSVFERIGFPAGAEEAGAVVGLADTNEGEFFVKLIPRQERDLTTREYIEQLRREVGKISGLQMNLRQPFEQLFNTDSKSITLHILGSDLPTLKDIMRRVWSGVSTIDGFRDAEMDLMGGRPELRLNIDRHEAAKAGLDVSRIGEAVRLALQGRKIGTFRLDGEEVYLRLRGPDQLNTDPQALLDLPLEVRKPRPGQARTIRTREVATLTEGQGEEKLRHKRQLRQGTISANYAKRALGDVMADVLEVIGKIPLPDGYYIEISGLYKDLQASIEQLIQVFLLGLLLVYMIMASQFESFRDPFCVMFTVPLAVIGMIGALYVCGQTLNISSALGLIILLGVVVNDAIVLVDFVRQRRLEGLGEHEALLDAATARLRPIVMTTLTTVLALLPISFGFGEGSEVQQPLAISIVGGLTFATALTLFVIPCLHSILHPKRRK